MGANEIQVTCSAAPDAVPHAAATIHSLLAHGDERVRIHFLHGPSTTAELTAPLRAMVERLGGAVDLHLVPDARVAGLPERAGTRAMWYRVLLPELVPDLDRAIHVDTDAVAMGSLAELWRTDLGGNLLGAVTNVFQPDHVHRVEQLGMGDPRAYFNSGVMLMDLEAMRRAGAAAAVLDYARAHPGLMAWQDQDALNVVLADRRLPLHPRWNAMNSLFLFPWADEVYGAEAAAEARARPAVRHFEGPGVNKPWHYMCERPMREAYFEHRRATPWPDVELEGRTPANTVRRLLRRGA